MTDKMHLTVVDRRSFVLGATAVAAFAALSPLASGSAAAKGWQDFMNEATKGAKPAEGKVTIKLPEIAENGSTVPYEVNVDSPMTDADYVKSVYVYATGNPGPQIIEGHFTPLAGKAFVKSRMRLAKTQDVVAIAEMSDGKFFMGKSSVKVTIGGCGG